jgi:hypothetical protein
MKYFTPELYLRGQSADDAVVRAVEEAWEEASERYERHLRVIEPEMPEHVREFGNLLLHDADVYSIARRDSQLIMVLRKDAPPCDVVVLTYHLTEEPHLSKGLFPKEYSSVGMQFLYDEMDLIKEGGRTVYAQSILFSNGWEMALRFSDVRVLLAQPVYPEPRPTEVVPAALTQSA